MEEGSNPGAMWVTAEDAAVSRASAGHSYIIDILNKDKCLSLPNYFKGYMMKKINKVLLLLSAVSTMLSATVYQDHTTMDASKWRVFDNTPAGAEISVVNDDLSGMPVIELKGSGIQNGYILGNKSGKEAWKNRMGTKMMWGSRFNEDFMVYISVQTKKGYRYLYYTPVDKDLGIDNHNRTYIHHGIGSNASDGQWRGFERDLETDLEEFEPENRIISVNAFLVRGSGYISEIVIHDENYAKIVTASNDGSRVFSSNGNMVSVLRANNLKERPLATFETDGTVKDMALSGSGERLAVLHSGSLEIFDVSISFAPELLGSYPVYNGLSLAIDESCTKAFIGKKDGVVAIDIGL